MVILKHIYYIGILEVEMFKLFKNLGLKEWLEILLCAGLIVLNVWLELKIPEYMTEITKLVQTPGSQMRDIWIQGGYMLACAFGGLATISLVSFFAAKISSTLAFRLRKKIYDKVDSFSMEEIGKFSTSSLITRTTNDVTQVQMFLAMGMQFILKAPVLAIWAVCKISGKSLWWTLATAGGVLILITILTIVIVFALPKFKIIQKLTDNLNRVTRENLTGVRVVRAYNAEGYQEGKFQKANSDLTKTNLFTNRIMAIMMPGMTLIMSMLSLSIYWIGAYLVNKASGFEKLAVFSDMVVYSSYAIQVVLSFMLLIIIFIILPRASVAAKRINEVLDTESKVVDGEGMLSTSQTGTVEFKNVSFKYPDASEYVLNNVSFCANKGETIAFIGSTGSGKSTLINLIPRFYDATEGEVLIDGINVKDYKQKDLHDKIGYVSQKAVIFSGTVEENINFNGESEKETKQKLLNSAKIAQASEFVEKMEKGYNSNIAQSGTNISGGQKQRLSIARAIFKNPEFLIFDDSFSALDYNTDKLLRESLKRETKDTTIFIVAQRIGTIKNADKIIVLDEGKVVGMGRHDQLLKNCEVYREIALSQLSKEELENA